MSIINFDIFHNFLRSVDRLPSSLLDYVQGLPRHHLIIDICPILIYTNYEQMLHKGGNRMKVAVSSLDNTLTASLDRRFGRATYFLIVDTATMTFSVVDNSAQMNAGGAGIAAAQLVIDHGAEAVITGQIGPNALDVLSQSDMMLYQGIPGSIDDNILAFNQNKLTRITSSGPAHAGMRH
jgi:predicted Fe-Mo cluster-binding NifX family protein